MSIYTALRAGVSGLSAQSSALAVISDNIANVNTTGYKRGTTDFAPLVNGQSKATTYNAGGVVATTRRLVDLQGSLEQSRSATDLAVVGDGFFVVSSNTNDLAEGGDALFTRSGSFSVDADGNLINAQGFYLQGWKVESDGSVQTSPTSLATVSRVNVAGVGGVAEPTDTLGINGNLSATQNIYNLPVVPANPVYATGTMANNTVSPHFESTMEVFDSLGASRTLTIGFLKTGANQWGFEVYARPAGTVDAAAHPNGLLSSGFINFNGDGTINSVTNQATPPVPYAPFSVNWAGTTGANDQTIDLDLRTGMTQFATAYGISSVTADGVPPGELVGLALEGEGFITAQFSNGRTRALYQLPLATFLAPNLLEADQGGTFRSTLDAGQFTLNAMGFGGAGRIESGVLEASNVDLANEFTTLITTQRAYSASSRIITTADEMLEELLSIKR
jgi:flagellar hook protein FlgE